MKKRFTEEQIIGFLREAEAGMPVKELCRQHGFSEASYYLWRSKFGRHERAGSQAAEGPGGRERTVKEAAGRASAGERSDRGCSPEKMVGAPARRERVRHMKSTGLSERRSWAVIGMSASAYRYETRLDRNVELR